MIAKKMFLFFLLPFLGQNSQIKVITLNNPSFEGEPQDATMPMGWQACKEGTTPDILPGSWGVYNQPTDGNTFLGLITREDGSWESVGQRLSSPMEANGCYNFSLDLANSKTYTGYNKPIKLKIWGGQTSCAKDELLAETDFISHSEWKQYAFKLYTTKTINYIILEAQYMDGVYIPYKGNVLIDNLSVLKACRRA